MFPNETDLSDTVISEHITSISIFFTLISKKVKIWEACKYIKALKQKKMQFIEHTNFTNF